MKCFLLQLPAVLVSLQRSVHAVLLEKHIRPHFLTHGIPADSLVDSFYLDTNCLMTIGEKSSSSSGDSMTAAPCERPILTDVSHMSATALASDGKFLYVLTARGLLKIGTGFSATVKGFVYACNKDVACRAWIGFCNVNDSFLYYF